MGALAETELRHSTALTRASTPTPQVAFLAGCIYTGIGVLRLGEKGRMG